MYLLQLLVDALLRELWSPSRRHHWLGSLCRARATMAVRTLEYEGQSCESRLRAVVQCRRVSSPDLEAVFGNSFCSKQLRSSGRTPPVRSESLALIGRSSSAGPSEFLTVGDGRSSPTISERLRILFTDYHDRDASSNSGV